MPKKMVWIELLFRYFPTDKLTQQMFLRFCFLLLVWFTGLLSYAIDGLTMSYVLDLQIYQSLFGSGLIVLFGSYMIQNSLHELILSFRSLLRLDDLLFRKFAERVERYSYSFIPCFLIALVLTVFLSNAPSEYQEGLVNGFALHRIWNLSFSFFNSLLISTGIWFGISILLTIFLISRQPLEVELSSKTIEKFRGLSMLALWFSFFYFLANTIGITTAWVGAPALSLLDIILSPFLFFIAIGVVSVLFPFYNIHKTLLRSKTQELLKIEEELELLQQQLDEILAGRPSRRLSDQTIAIMGRLSSLGIKERNARAAQEWPIDIGFLSKLVGLVLLPIVSRILMEILNWFLH